MRLILFRPYRARSTATPLTQGSTLGFTVAPFQGSFTKHAGTAEPFRVSPPEAVVYLNANSKIKTPRITQIARIREKSLNSLKSAQSVAFLILFHAE
jgi:hypothetical protein